MTTAFQPAAVTRLLQLAGPDLAAELQRRLVDDLARVANCIAVAKGDFAALQAQSHVLIALAGTAGASALHANADRLHQMAIDRDAKGLAALAPQVIDDTRALISAIAALALP